MTTREEGIIMANLAVESSSSGLKRGPATARWRSPVAITHFSICVG